MSQTRQKITLGGLVALVSLAIGPTGAVTAGDPLRQTTVSKGKIVSEARSLKSNVLERLVDKHRPVLVFGPKTDDPRVTRQRHAWVGALPEAGLKDRDIVVLEVLGAGESKLGAETIKPEEAKELYSAFGLKDDTFAVVLIGRDGSEKTRWTEPVSAQEIFGKVDAMPMRQQEVQAKGGGSE